jgi:hypothetical protein
MKEQKRLARRACTCDRDSSQVVTPVLQDPHARDRFVNKNVENKNFYFLLFCALHLPSPAIPVVGAGKFKELVGTGTSRIDYRRGSEGRSGVGEHVTGDYWDWRTE